MHGSMSIKFVNAKQTANRVHVCFRNESMKK